MSQHNSGQKRKLERKRHCCVLVCSQDIPEVLITQLHRYCPDAFHTAKVSRLLAGDFNGLTERQKCDSSFGMKLPILPYTWAIPHLKREFEKQFEIDQPFWDWVGKNGWVAGGSVLRALLCTKFTEKTWPIQDSDIDVYVPMALVHSATAEFHKMFVKDVPLSELCVETVADYEKSVVCYNFPWKNKQNKIQLIGITTPFGVDNEVMRKEVVRWVDRHFDLAILRVCFDGNSIHGFWNPFNAIGITQRNWMSKPFEPVNGKEPDTPLVVSDKTSMELVIRSHKYTRRGLKIQLDDGNPVRLPDVVYIHFVMPTKQDICPLQSNLDWLTPALFSKACRTGISIVPVLNCMSKRKHHINAIGQDLPTVKDIPSVLNDTLRTYCGNAAIYYMVDILLQNCNGSKRYYGGFGGLDGYYIDEKWGKAHLVREFEIQHGLPPAFWSWVEQFGLVAGGSVLRALLPNLFVNDRWPAQKSDIDVFVPEHLIQDAMDSYSKLVQKLDPNQPRRVSQNYFHATKIYNLEFSGTVAAAAAAADAGPEAGPAFIELERTTGATAAAGGASDEATPIRTETMRNVQLIGVPLGSGGNKMEVYKQELWMWIRKHFDFQILKIAFDGKWVRGAWSQQHSLGIEMVPKDIAPILATTRDDVARLYRLLKYRRRGVKFLNHNNPGYGQPVQLHDKIYVPFAGSPTGFHKPFPLSGDLHWITAILLKNIMKEKMELVPIFLDCHDCENKDLTPWLKHKTIPNYQWTPYCTKHDQCKKIARSFYQYIGLIDFFWDDLRPADQNQHDNSSCIRDYAFQEFREFIKAPASLASLASEARQTKESKGLVENPAFSTVGAKAPKS